MAKYFVKKGIQLIIVTILISFFSFAVIYAAPGDISGMYLNEQMSDEEKEAIRENLGLNKSMPEQYWGWAKEVLKGDFGISLANHTSVSEQIIKRLPQSVHHALLRPAPVSFFAPARARQYIPIRLEAQ